MVDIKISGWFLIFVVSLMVMALGAMSVILIDGVVDEIGRTALVDYAQIAAAIATTLTLFWLVYAYKQQREFERAQRNIGELDAIIREFITFLDTADLILTHGRALTYTSKIHSKLSMLDWSANHEHSSLRELASYISLHYLKRLKVTSLFEMSEKDVTNELYILFYPHLSQHLVKIASEKLSTERELEEYKKNLAICMDKLHEAFEMVEAEGCALPTTENIVPLPLLLELYSFAHPENMNLINRVFASNSDMKERDVLIEDMLGRGYIGLAAYFSAFINKEE